MRVVRACGRDPRGRRRDWAVNGLVKDGGQGMGVAPCHVESSQNFL